MANRVHLLGIDLDPLVMSEVIERIFAWSKGTAEGCRFVVTPNVDHAVMLKEHEGLRRAYDNAALVLADGAPLIVAARLLKAKVPGRVPGSDLVPALCEAADKHGGLRVFLLGAAPGVGQRAAEQIKARWPMVETVGVYSPPMGFEHDSAENERILALIAEARPEVLVVGLGAPKQELWVNENRYRIAAPVALCTGAAIDFLAGEKRRAPRWMRRAGLEWLHRLASEPRRLARRYARDLWIFPRLVAAAWLANLAPRSIRRRVRQA